MAVGCPAVRQQVDDIIVHIILYFPRGVHEELCNMILVPDRCQKILSFKDAKKILSIYRICVSSRRINIERESCFFDFSVFRTASATTW